LQKVTPDLKKQIIHIVKNNNNDKKKVKFVIDNVVANGGIEYATQKMIDYRDKALDILHGFPESPSREALEELVRYTTDRAY
jgi:octaprenyl-diphosphate synthase